MNLSVRSKNPPKKRITIVGQIRSSVFTALEINGATFGNLAKNNINSPCWCTSLWWIEVKYDADETLHAERFSFLLFTCTEPSSFEQ